MTCVMERLLSRDTHSQSELPLSICKSVPLLLLIAAQHLTEVLLLGHMQIRQEERCKCMHVEYG